jgi:Flp pilus assembly protein TadG
MGTRATNQARASYGQATVEFAVVSVVFLMIVLGSIDFGRSIYIYSQLNNAVRDAAREGKVALSSGSGVDSTALSRRVRIFKNRETNAETPRPGLEAAVASVSCSGGCAAGDKLTVSATLDFQAVTQGFLGISPITLKASSTVVLE